MGKPKVWVCRKCRHSDCLAAFLIGSGGTKVKKVGCQKICQGPVAAAKVEGRMEWFARVDRAKPMVALRRAAKEGRSGRIPPALEARRVIRRSGRPVH